MIKFLIVITWIVTCNNDSTAQKTKVIASFQNFPKNADPKLIGKRISERFMERPQSTFGAFKVIPPSEITYPDAPVHGTEP